MKNHEFILHEKLTYILCSHCVCVKRFCPVGQLIIKHMINKATSNIGAKQTSLSIPDHDKQIRWYSKCSSHKYHSKTWHFYVNFKHGYNPDTVLKQHVSEQLIQKKIRTAKHETAESVHMVQFQQKICSSTTRCA